jgi:hypothetical protein
VTSNLIWKCLLQCSGTLGLFSTPNSTNKLLLNSRTIELSKSSRINGPHSFLDPWSRFTQGFGASGVFHAETIVSQNLLNTRISNNSKIYGPHLPLKLTVEINFGLRDFGRLSTHMTTTKFSWSVESPNHSGTQRKTLTH